MKIVWPMKPKRPSIDDTVPSTPFLAKYHDLFDSEDLWAAARKSGAVERQRKVDLPALVEASVLALSGLPGTQTTIFANYLHLGGAKVVPSAFYDRFTHEFAVLMGELANRAVAAVRAVAENDPLGQELAGLLDHFKDVRVVDSTCSVLQKLAANWAPSTNNTPPASFKLHSVVSLRDGLPIQYEISPQREHDTRHLDEAALTPGTLFMADLGYVDDARLLRLVDSGVHVLMRLKNSQNPRIHRVYVGRGDRRACRGMRLDEAFAAGVLEFERGTLDLDVMIDAGDEPRKLRVVALAKDDAATECWFYLTSVPREVLSPENVSVAYTMRWDIELIWKHLKTGAGMAAIRAWKQESVTALVHAKLIAIALARLLELSVAEATKDHAMGQMAIMLTLNRMVPLIIAMRLRERGVSLAEMERRMLTITLILARSRRQRRERAKSAQRATLRRTR
jgi:hypothetical protein